MTEEQIKSRLGSNYIHYLHGLALEKMLSWETADDLRAAIRVLDRLCTEQTRKESE